MTKEGEVHTYVSTLNNTDEYIESQEAQIKGCRRFSCQPLSKAEFQRPVSSQQALEAET